jgi:hypothetical protein
MPEVATPPPPLRWMQVHAIRRFLDAWNANCHPFAWVNTADQILASAKLKAISGPVH